MLGSWSSHSFTASDLCALLQTALITVVLGVEYYCGTDLVLITTTCSRHNARHSHVIIRGPVLRPATLD